MLRFRSAEIFSLNRMLSAFFYLPRQGWEWSILIRMESATQCRTGAKRTHGRPGTAFFAVGAQTINQVSTKYLKIILT